jgi:WD40 repeat protein
VFAKPFVAAFTHDDGVTCLARNLKHLNGLVRSTGLPWCCVHFVDRDRCLVHACPSKAVFIPALPKALRLLLPASVDAWCAVSTRLHSQVSGCADGNIHLWDVPARRCLRKLIGHTGAQAVACLLLYVAPGWL